MLIENYGMKDGFYYSIVFYNGYRCGYVGIPKSKDEKGKFTDSDQINELLSKLNAKPKFDLGYTKECKAYEENNISPVRPFEKVTWFGFDSMHANNLYDIDKANELLYDKDEIEYMEKHNSRAKNRVENAFMATNEIIKKEIDLIIEYISKEL